MQRHYEDTTLYTIYTTCISLQQVIVVATQHGVCIKVSTLHCARHRAASLESVESAGWKHV